jgi:hypothetical protein
LRGRRDFTKEPVAFPIVLQALTNRPTGIERLTFAKNLGILTSTSFLSVSLLFVSSEPKSLALFRKQKSTQLSAFRRLL